MPDQLVGYLLIGVGVLRRRHRRRCGSGRYRGPLHPPPGVHVPPGSWLPVAVGRGRRPARGRTRLQARGPGLNWWFAIPGLVLFIVAALVSIRVASREWRETEDGSHDEGAAHH